MLRLFVVAPSGGSSAAMRRLLLVAASLVAERRLWAQGFSSCATWALERRLSGCGTRA